MGCYCNAKQSPSTEGLQCIQVFCTQKRSKSLQAIAGQNKLIMEIKLKIRDQNSEYKFAQSDIASPLIHNEGYVVKGELQQSGVILVSPNVYAASVSNCLLEMIKHSQNERGVVIFIEQPLCSQRVNLSKLYEHTFKGVLIANSQLEQKGVSKIRSKMDGLEKKKVVISWGRIKQKQMVKIMEKIIDQLNEAQSNLRNGRQ